MLYTANVLDIQKIKKNMKIYYIIKNHGNDVVSPEQVDLDHYKRGLLTWEGFKLNYLSKIYKSEANEWMRKVSNKAASNDVVLVDEEKDANHSPRKLLAELMMNMYYGSMKLHYNGEITNKLS